MALRTSSFARLNPESAEYWEQTGAVLLGVCDMQSGLGETPMELQFTVIGFSGEKDYSIETGAEFFFGDQSVGTNGNRGKLTRGIGSCVLYGARQQLTITKVDKTEFYRVGIAKPDAGIINRAGSAALPSISRYAF